MADSVLYTLLDFAEYLSLMDKSDELDQAIAEPTPEMPAEVPIEGALLAKGLGL